MKRVLLTTLALAAMSSTAAFAQAQGTAPAAQPTQAQIQAQAQAGLANLSAPTEVGATIMPAGNYLVTDQISGKCFVLMVTSKGSMILSPAPTGVTAAHASPQAAAQIQAQAPAAAAVVTPAGASLASSTMKSLVNKGLSSGMSSLMKGSATKQLTKFIPK